MREKIENARKHGRVQEVAAEDVRKVGACSGRSQDGLGRGPIVTATRRFRKVRISRQAQHFGEPRYRFRGRRNTFARPSIDFVAGAPFPQRWHGRIANPTGTDASQGGACRFRGRHSTFARSGADFAAGTALSQGRVQISWQAQHFRKVRCRFRGRHDAFARSSTFRGTRSFL